MKKDNKNLPLNYLEKNNSRISLLCSIAVLVVLVLIFHQLDYATIRKPAKEAREAAKKVQEEKESAAREPVTSSVTVVAVGNTSFSGSVIESGISESGDWDYNFLFDNVREEIQSADLAIVGQESTMTADHETARYSQVTPMEVGTAMAEAGFDVIAAATNHVTDNGYEDIGKTLNFWKTSHPDVAVLGVQDTSSGESSFQTFTIHDISISVLNYCYEMIREEGQQSYKINSLNTAAAAADIEKARSVSDFVIVVPHWGKEQEIMPTEYEKEWAAFFLDHGVDVVIGSHPYVLQPYGVLSNDVGKEMVIFYSLGNFITSRQSLRQVLGGMARFTLEKTVSAEGTDLRVVSPSVEPLVMHYSDTQGSYGSCFLKDYTDEQAAAHSIMDSGEDFTVSSLKQEFQSIMSKNVTPSTKTTYLDMFFDTEGNMTDQYGNYMEDTESVSENDE